MRLWQLAEEFARQAEAVETEAALIALLDAAIRDLGFCYFALVHSLSYRRDAPHLIKIDTYPPWWSERFISERLYLHDPMLLASQSAGRGFRWDEVRRFVGLDHRALSVLAAAAQAGLGAGFTLPVHIPGEPNGSCSFATRCGADLPFRCLQCAGIIGGYAFESARRLHGYRINVSKVPHLSPRQLDCLVLVARGCQDKEIARELSLSPDTVHSYMKALRLVLGVSKRSEMALRAIRLGIIGFDDAIPPSG